MLLSSYGRGSVATTLVFPKDLPALVPINAHLLLEKVLTLCPTKHWICLSTYMKVLGNHTYLKAIWIIAPFPEEWWDRIQGTSSRRPPSIHPSVITRNAKPWDLWLCPIDAKCPLDAKCPYQPPACNAETPLTLNPLLHDSAREHRQLSSGGRMEK